MSPEFNPDFQRARGLPREPRTGLGRTLHRVSDHIVYSFENTDSTAKKVALGACAITLAAPQALHTFAKQLFPRD